MTGCPRPLPAERRSRGSAPSPAPRRVYRFLLAAERPCELVRAFPTRLPGPRPLSLQQLRNCGAWITAAVSAEGHREAQCAGASVRDPRRAALGCSRSEFLGAETRQWAVERAGDPAPPLQPWQLCATRAWTTRTARTSCRRAGSREPPRTAGFTMPSKGAAGPGAHLEP